MDDVFGQQGYAATMANAGTAPRPGETTGAFLVLFEEEQVEPGIDALRHAAGVERPEHVRAEDVSAAELASAPSIVFDELGVGVVAADPDQRPALLAAAGMTSSLLQVEPERVVWALGQPSTDYLLGYRDGVNDVLGRVLTGAQAAGEAVPAADWDESELTWGLQAVRAGDSKYTGRGVRVAVLDTGVNLAHRDLAGRQVMSRSFIEGEEAEDGHGHGTHCIGTACGKEQPAELPRYGVAPEAEIFAGKVLSDAGSGADRGILGGISWAVRNNCRVVSMSLGAPVRVGTTHSVVFERAAVRASRRGTIIVAAAGNDSARPGRVSPVSHPANCPTILAVAALTPDLRPAAFSNAGLNPQGGQIDIAAPGVAVKSSWPEPLGYRSLNGTSMATPHVAGVLALLAEQEPGASAAELRCMLLQNARRLELPASDVGAGLVQAP